MPLVDSDSLPRSNQVLEFLIKSGSPLFMLVSPVDMRAIVVYGDGALTNKLKVVVLARLLDAVVTVIG